MSSFKQHVWLICSVSLAGIDLQWPSPCQGNILARDRSGNNAKVGRWYNVRSIGSVLEYRRRWMHGERIFTVERWRRIILLQDCIRLAAGCTLGQCDRRWPSVWSTWGTVWKNRARSDTPGISERGGGEVGEHGYRPSHRLTPVKIVNNATWRKFGLRLFCQGRLGNAHQTSPGRWATSQTLAHRPGDVLRRMDCCREDLSPRQRSMPFVRELQRRTRLCFTRGP